MANYLTYTDERPNNRRKPKRTRLQEAYKHSVSIRTTDKASTDYGNHNWQIRGKQGARVYHLYECSGTWTTY